MLLLLRYWGIIHLHATSNAIRFHAFIQFTKSNIFVVIAYRLLLMDDVLAIHAVAVRWQVRVK